MGGGWLTPNVNGISMPWRKPVTFDWMVIMMVSPLYYDTMLSWMLIVVAKGNKIPCRFAPHYHNFEATSVFLDSGRCGDAAYINHIVFDLI